MRLNADSYFTIGQAHASAGDPCQDYADTRHWARADGSISSAWAGVSDGCSTSGRTDIGARLVVCGRSLADDELRDAAKRLGLGWKDMLATSFSILATRTSVRAKLFGDGVTAFRHAADDIIMSRIEWTGNRPYYPTYKIFAADGCEREFRRIQEKADQAIIEEAWHWNGDSFTPLEPVDGQPTLDQGIAGLTRRMDIPEGGGVAAVFTDGICQIQGVDWKDAVVAAMSYKNFAGRFVARRMMRMLKAMSLGDCYPIDDVACAAIRIVPADEG